MKNLPKELCKTWKVQYGNSQGWIVTDHSYVAFTADGQLSLLDTYGKLVHTFAFELKENNQIVLSDGRSFGQILELTKDLLTINKTYNEDSQDRKTYKRETFTVKQPIENQELIGDIPDFIYKHKWLGTYRKNGKALELALSSSASESYPLNLSFRRSRNGVFREKAFPGKIISFQNTYSIEFLVQEVYPDHLLDWIPISKISKKNLEIIAQLSDEAAHIVLELQSG